MYRKNLSPIRGFDRKAAVFVTRICTSILIACALATAGIAGAATHNASRVNTSCRSPVPWQNARKYIGRVATIKGPVASTKYASASNGSPTFLNIGVAYPSLRRVQVIIWGENRGRFGSPERRYRGHTICVRGLVDEYGGVPEIEATSPSQITVIR